jgi:hypothetical protein
MTKLAERQCGYVCGIPEKSHAMEEHPFQPAAILGAPSKPPAPAQRLTAELPQREAEATAPLRAELADCGEALSMAEEAYSTQLAELEALRRLAEAARAVLACGVGNLSPPRYAARVEAFDGLDDALDALPPEWREPA